MRLVNSDIVNYDPSENIRRANHDSLDSFRGFGQALVNKTVEGREYLAQMDDQFDMLMNDIDLSHQEQLKHQINSLQKQMVKADINDFLSGKAREMIRGPVSQMKILSKRSNELIERGKELKDQFKDNDFLDQQKVSKAVLDFTKDYNNVRNFSNGVDKLSDLVNREAFMTETAINDWVSKLGKREIRIGSTTTQAPTVVKGFDENGDPKVNLTEQEAAQLVERFPQLAQIALDNVNQTQAEKRDIDAAAGGGVIPSAQVPESELVRRELSRLVEQQVNTSFRQDPNYEYNRYKAQLDLQSKQAQIENTKARTAKTRSGGSGSSSGDLEIIEGEFMSADGNTTYKGQALMQQYAVKDSKRRGRTLVYDGLLRQGENYFLLKKNSKGEIEVVETDEATVTSIINTFETARSDGDTNTLKDARESLKDVQSTQKSNSQIIDEVVDMFKPGERKKVKRELKRRGFDVDEIEGTEIYPRSMFSNYSADDAKKNLKQFFPDKKKNPFTGK